MGAPSGSPAGGITALGHVTALRRLGNPRLPIRFHAGRTFAFHVTDAQGQRHSEVFHEGTSWQGELDVPGHPSGGTLVLSTSHPGVVVFISGQRQVLDGRPASHKFWVNLRQAGQACLEDPVEIVARIEGGPANGDEARVQLSISPP